MSRQKVVTGTDAKGRPITEWQGGDDELAPRYGFMQPAHDPREIERRSASDEERARWAASPAPSPIAPTTAHVGRYTPEELQERRSRGQAAMRAAMPAPAAPAPQEEIAVTEPAPAPEPEVEDLQAGPYTDLAAAALEAARRHEAAIGARQLADLADAAYRASLVVLERAWANAGMTTPLVTPGPGPDKPAELEELPAAAAPAAASKLPRRKRSSEPKPQKTQAGRLADRDVRATLVLAALERHNGDTKAAGEELGMRGNIVARIASTARARQAAAAGASA